MQQVTVWIAKTLAERLFTKAGEKAPLETGGVIAGYWNGDDDVVVLDVSGSGANANHEAFRFEPDYVHHEHWIAEIYQTSEGVATYLGDWHTHPGQEAPDLSGRDIRTLRAIARAPEARAPRPLMLVIAGDDADWGLYAWVGERIRRLGLWPSIEPRCAMVSIY